MKIDDKELTLDERQVYLAAFGSFVTHAGYVRKDEVQPGQESVSARTLRDNGHVAASSAVRVFRMALAAGLLGLLALAGCTGVHAPIDAGAGDAPLRNGCLDLLNTWETYAPAGCERPSCPFPGPVSQTEIDWCNQTLYAARGECNAMQAALESCR